MLKLRNKTRGASKVGYLVKVVRGGFEYAGYGDTPIGVVTEICPAGRFCKIQTEGKAFVYVGKTVKEGQQIRMKNEDEKLPAGQSVPVTGDETSFTSIGYTIGKGRGLVEVSLNIGSAAGGAGGGGGIEEAPLTGSQYARQSGAWSIVSSGFSDAPADNIAYSRYNNSWVNSNLIIDYSGGTGAFAAVVNYDERLTIVGDGTYIGSTYSTYVNGLSQTIHQIQLSFTPGALDTEWYLASADGQQGTPRTVYDNRGIGNDAVVVFLDGAYTTVTQYVNTNTAFYSPTFGQAVNELTIEVDHAQLRTDGYLYYQSDITTLLSGYATQSWVTTNFDNYANWVAEANGTPVQTVSSGNSLNFAAGANMTVTWGGPDTLTFAMTTAFGTMNDWYMAVDYVPGAPVTHTIQNHTIVDFQGGTYINAAYTFVTPVHGVAFDINTTTLDSHYATLHYLKSEVYTKSEADSAFDNYNYWSVSANGTPVSTVSSLGALNFNAGSNMTISWGGPNTLTFAMTGSFGTMSSWNWRILSTNHTINNGGTAELIAGTGISIGYTLGGGGEHQATISSSVTMVYPSAGIALSNGSGWLSSIANNSANWNTAYSWGNHAGLYDDYSHWDVYTGGVFRESISSGDRVDFVGGTDIQVIYAAAANTLTFNWTGTAGTMTNWYINTDHVDTPKAVANGQELYLIGGTGIDLTEVVWSTGNLRYEMTIASTITSSQWTSDTNGITYTAGNVGIGAASHSSYDLSVGGTTWLQGAATMAGTITFSGNNNQTAGSLQFYDNVEIEMGTGNDYSIYFSGSHLYFDSVASTTDIYFRSGTTQRFLFDISSGYGTAADWYATSDIRTKKNIQPLYVDMDKFCILGNKAIRHNWKEGWGPANTPEIGFIAQDVEEFYPELVEIGKEVPHFRAISYGKLVTVAIKAGAQTWEMVTEIKSEVDALKDKVMELQMELNILKNG